jgi:hypothetical protein
MGRKVSVAVPVLACTKVAGMDRAAVCATTLRVLAELAYWARTFPAILTRGANVLTEYDPVAGALKLVAYEPVRVVLVLARVTQRVPDLRWTVTGLDAIPGSFPVTLAVSALIAVAGVSRMYGACTDTTFDGDATADAPRQDNATAR